MRNPAQDQAAGLRRLFVRRELLALAIAPVAGARGSAGLALRAADRLAAQGRIVAVLDEHPGDDGIAGMLGLRLRYDLEQFANGDVTLSRAALRPREGLMVLSAKRFARMRADAAEEIVTRSLQKVREAADIVIAHAAPAQGSGPSPLTLAAHRLAAVVPMEECGITEAQALLKRAATSPHVRAATLVALAAGLAPPATLLPRLLALASGELGLPVTPLCEPASDPVRGARSDDRRVARIAAELARFAVQPCGNAFDESTFPGGPAVAGTLPGARARTPIINSKGMGTCIRPPAP